MKKLILGFIVSALLIYFTFQNIEYDLLFNSIESVNYNYLILAILLSKSLYILRSIRLQVMLAPLGHLTQKILFPITCFGFMAIP